MILILAVFGGNLLPGTGADGDALAITVLTEPLDERTGGIFVQTGDAAYLFGGAEGWNRVDTIYRVDPATGAMTLMQARLPVPLSHASAVWTGEHVFIFGGCHYTCSRTDQILRYDPTTDQLDVMAARLPEAAYRSAAVWTGTHAYVFGGATIGCGSPCGTNVIARYDPATDEAVAIATTMPASAWWSMSAVWTGEEAYLFGGYSYTGAVNLLEEHDTILRFDPTTESILEVPERLPSAMGRTTAAWDGEAAHIFHIDHQTVRYEPGRPSQVMHALVPGNVCCQAAAVVDGAVTLLTIDYATQTTAVVRYLPGLDFVNAPPDPVLVDVPATECVDGGAVLTLDASTSEDADGDALAFAWSAIRAPHGDLLKDHATSTVTRQFPVGITTATATVSDGREPRSTTATVAVIDSALPTGAVTRPVHATYVLDEPDEALAPLADRYGGPVAIGPITLAADAADLCGVVYVAFVVDGEPMRVRKPPYQVTLHEPAGVKERTVLVVVRDLSGQELKIPLTFLHVSTRVPVGPWLGNMLHDDVCSPMEVTPLCDAVLGPDPYSDW